MKAIKTLMAAAMTATLALAGGCADNDDLYEKFDDLVVRVDALEKTVNEINKITIPGMQSIVAAIQGNIYVTSVTPGDNGYTITFSDGTTAVITDGVDGEKGDKGDTPVVGVVEADGEFYWELTASRFLTLPATRSLSIRLFLSSVSVMASGRSPMTKVRHGPTWMYLAILVAPLFRSRMETQP